MNRELFAAGLNGESRPAFEEGNTIGLRHGGSAVVSLRDQAAEAAALVKQTLAEDYDDRYALSVTAAGLAVARVERAVTYHDELEGQRERGEIDVSDYRQWMDKCEEALGRAHRDLWKWLSAMGLTPASDAALVRDRGVAADSGSRAAERVRRHVAKRREQGELDAASG